MRGRAAARGRRHRHPLAKDEAERQRFWAGPQERVSRRRAASRPTTTAWTARFRAANCARVLKGIEELSAEYGLRVANVFHAGDGNMHPLILFDANAPGETRTRRSARRAHPRTVRRGGRQHHRRTRRGPRKDQPDVRAVQSATSSRCFHALKAAFDPDGLLNPGKNIPTLAPLRRIRLDARPSRRAAVSRTGALLMRRRTRSRWTTASGSSPRSRARSRAARRSHSRRRQQGVSRPPRGRHAELDTRSHRGIVSYDPTELVDHRARRHAARRTERRARRRRPDAAVRAAGASTVTRHRRRRGREPDCLGPRRPWSGSVRDFVLGCRVITGEAKHLRFGGEVMKNVAGYDVSRLLAGSFGCLGVDHGSVAEGAAQAARTSQPRCSNSTPPKRCASCPPGAAPCCRSAAPAMSTAVCTCGSKAARDRWGRRWIASAAPNSTCASGTSLREQRLPFFDDPRPLWRLSMPNAYAARPRCRARCCSTGPARSAGSRAMRRPRRSARSRRPRAVTRPASRRTPDAEPFTRYRRAAAALSPATEAAARPARHLQPGPHVRRPVKIEANTIMQTNLSEARQNLPRADEAEQILRSCVHCGFCNATCPTYQLLGNELDGPRGRIYLIKQMLEGEPVTQKTQLHLDRCLTCRNCETTCPSGVTYHALLDIGRAELERRIERPALRTAAARGFAPRDSASRRVRRAAENRPGDAAVPARRAWT